MSLRVKFADAGAALLAVCTAGKAYEVHAVRVDGGVTFVLIAGDDGDLKWVASDQVRAR